MTFHGTICRQAALQRSCEYNCCIQIPAAPKIGWLLYGRWQNSLAVVFQLCSELAKHLIHVHQYECASIHYIDSTFILT